MKKIIVFGLSAVFLTGAFAVASPASAVTLSEIQAQIQSLLNQIKQIEVQNQTATAIDSVTDWCFNFKSNLRRGDTGKQVANLHTALQKEGYAIDKGEISNKRFGDSTKKAVTAFQEKYASEILTPINETQGTGIVANTTRAKLNQLYGCSSAATVTPTTTTPSITVLSPNGGEKWEIGKTYEIKWDLKNLEANQSVWVDVFLSLDNERDNRIIAAKLSPERKNLQWTILAEQYPTNIKPGDDFKILVTLTRAVGGFKELVSHDESDAPFSIVNSAAPSITVLSPNGGEKWQIGSFHTITWEPYSYKEEIGYPDVNPAYDVSAYLEYKTSSGDFVGVGKVEEMGRASIHWDGQYVLNGDVFSEVKPGDYYIRVVNNKTGAGDRSDNSFKLMPNDSITADLKLNGSDGPIRVPDGGKNYTASWSSTNAGSCNLHNNTLPWPAGFIGGLAPSGKRIIKLAPNTESYDKNVSLVCYGGDIEGYAWDSVLVLPQGASNSSIKITAPNGGELVNYNSWNLVIFDATSVETVSLALYKNNKFFAWITKDYPIYKGTGQGWGISWLPSDVISQDKIGKDFGKGIFKIYAIGKKAGKRGAVTDISDKPFTISN